MQQTNRHRDVASLRQAISTSCVCSWRTVGAWTRSTKGLGCIIHEGTRSHPSRWRQQAGHLDIVRFLVPHASWSRPDHHRQRRHPSCDGGYDALMWAAYGGHQEVVAFLLTQGTAAGAGSRSTPASRLGTDAG